MVVRGSGKRGTNDLVAGERERGAEVEAVKVLL